VGARTASGTKGIAEPPAAAPSHAASIADSASTMQPPVPEIDASALRKATEPPVSPSFVAASRASAKRPVASQPPISAEEQSLYDTAHRSHFVDHDPAAAVRGWDAYLQAYPDGRFALEAQYNRAIALVRLGRRDAGRAALTPFARGAYGGYRRAEAQELLDALDAADGGGAAP